MTSLSQQQQTLLFQSVPSPLQDRVLQTWDAWQQACDAVGLDPAAGQPLELMGKVFASSEYLAQNQVKMPAVWQSLNQSGDLQRALELDDYREALRSLLEPIPTTDHAGLMKTLRVFRNTHMLRIGWRDLAGWAPTRETLENLSDLAEACIDVTLEKLYRQLCQQLGIPRDANGDEQRLIVLGMGKLGGRELNYSSDIDLIFGFAEEGTLDGPRPMANSQFFTRLGQLFIKTLNDITADGFVFRVDMRLRPYGDSGPLVMSFDGMEQYYQTQGRDWERYAMIKARVVGGDRQAGAELMAMLRPFVYRRYLDFGAFQSIRDMKALIEAEINRKGVKHNIKLGKGGIREIEFIGQTFQLIRGGGDPELQIRSILDVLPLLEEKELLSRDEVAALLDSYDFLRRLENRLQMYDDRQTQVLPDDPRRQASLAVAMDYPDWDSLYAASRQHRHAVHEVFSQVFAAQEEADRDTGENRQLHWSAALDDDSNCDKLQQAGLEPVAEIHQLLKNFYGTGRVKALPETGRQRLDRLMPLLLGRLVQIDNPLETLTRVLNLLEAIIRRSVYLALLAEYPQALEQMLRLCSASPWISGLLNRYPVLLDELLDVTSLYQPMTRDELQQQLDDLLQHKMDDEEQSMEQLRQFKQAQVLRVAAMDIAGQLNVFDVSDSLSDIAEVILEKALQLSWNHMVQRHGRPRCVIDGESVEPGFAIIGYGKMGGRELGYGSDLDIVFLHNSDGEQQISDGDKPLDNRMYFARLAQRLVHIMNTNTANGRLYEIDTRLRPDGAAGMLVSSVSAFEQYQQDKAWTWEHQALVRARMLTGPAQIADEFDRIREDVLTRDRDEAQLRTEVLEMRQKMREALGSKDTEQFHIKQDAGGLVDIEFLSQFCVLAGSRGCPELLQQTAARELLLRLPACGLLDEAQVDTLLHGLEVYRRLLNEKALQETTSTVATDTLNDCREAVSKIWQAVLEKHTATS